MDTEKRRNVQDYIQLGRMRAEELYSALETKDFVSVQRAMSTWYNWRDLAVDIYESFIPEALEEIERLRDALKVYADEESWTYREGDDPNKRYVWIAGDDGPSVARAALGED